VQTIVLFYAIYSTFLHLLYSLHAARYAERGGDGRQDADGYLNHHFPGFLFHHLLLFKGFYDWGWMELMGEAVRKLN